MRSTATNVGQAKQVRHPKNRTSERERVLDGAVRQASPRALLAADELERLQEFRANLLGDKVGGCVRSRSCPVQQHRMAALSDACHHPQPRRTSLLLEAAGAFCRLVRMLLLSNTVG